MSSILLLRTSSSKHKCWVDFVFGQMTEKIIVFSAIWNFVRTTAETWMEKSELNNPLLRFKNKVYISVINRQESRTLLSSSTEIWIERTFIGYTLGDWGTLRKSVKSMFLCRRVRLILFLFFRGGGAQEKILGNTFLHNLKQSV